MSDTFEAALTRVREMFAVVGFSDGGLLLHLGSGDFFALDPGGASLWQAVLESGTAAEAVSAVSRTKNLAGQAARVAVERLVRQGLQLNAEPPANIHRFEDDGRCLSLLRAGQVVLTFDRSRLLLTSGPALLERLADDGDIEDALRIVVPKILGAWFPLALHASAVEHNGTAFLFSGDSGSGKTTTARLVVEELTETRLMAEDVSLIATVAGQAYLVEGAEGVIHAWMEQTAATLARCTGMPVDAASFRAALDDCSGRLPVHRITFLDRARRNGLTWRLVSLTHAAALQRLFLHNFPCSAAPVVLRQQLASLRQLASTLDIKEADAIPEGLANLRRAIRAQSETIMS